MKKILSLLTLAAVCSGAVGSTLEFRLGRSPEAPKQDNRIGKNEYRYGISSAVIISEKTKLQALRNATFYAARDSQNLYLAASSPLTPYSNIPLTAKDEIIFTVRTANGKELIRSVNPKQVPSFGKNWHWEIAIPWSDFGGMPKQGEVWNITMTRKYQNPVEIAKAAAKVTFDDDAPGISYSVVHGDPTGQFYQICRWVVTYPAGKTGNVLCKAEIESLGNPETINSVKAPNEKGEIIFDLPLTSADNLHRTMDYALTSGRKILMKHKFSWDPAQGLNWKKKYADTGTGFAVYPSFGLAKGRLYSEDMNQITKYDKVEFVIRDAQEREVQRVVGKFTKFGNELIWKLPELKEGQYFIGVECWKNGKVVWKHRSSFEWKKYPWAGNKIGDDRIIVPPFKPLVADQQKNTVKALLTGYEFGRKGRFAGVFSQGENILNGEINFYLNKKPLSAGKISYQEVAADRVRLTDETSAQGVKFRFGHEVDYDGMILTTMEVIPSGKTKVESFHLDIPVKKEIAELFHTTQWLRRNPAGYIPQGNGVVWSSRFAPQYGAPGNFRSYMWIGGVRKGICWFGESDLHYSLDSNKSHMELIRNGESVIIRIHVVNAPCVWEKPFKIVMGIQATPVKPQLPSRRKYSSITETGYTAANSIPIAQLMGLLFWGSSDGVRPVNGDFSYTRFLQNAGRMTTKERKEFVNQFIKKHYNVLGKNERRSRSHLGHSANNLARNAKLFVPYTNPRYFNTNWPEIKMYGDEWNMDAFRNFRYNEYGAVPFRSFQDFMLYHLRAAVRDGGLSGIYFDNTNETQNYDSVMGPVREYALGKYSPQYSFLGMRQLVKRTAVMLHQEGKTIDGYPLIVMHMTNCNMVPVMSFASHGLDWEMNYNGKDYQERFPHDFILAESLGTQTGLSPISLLHTSGTKEAREHQLRTALALFFAYDLIDFFSINASPTTPTVGGAIDTVRNFGYGEKDCQVYPFYDGNQPVTVSSDKVRFTVLKRGGKALIMAGDFGHGGEITFDLKKLNFKNPFMYDAETKRLIGKGQQIKTGIKYHYYRLFLVTDGESEEIARMKSGELFHLFADKPVTFTAQSQMIKKTLDRLPEAYSFVLWAKPARGGSNGPMISMDAHYNFLGYSEKAIKFNFVCYSNDGKYRDSGTYKGYSYPGKWYFLVGTANPATGEITLYINGKKAAQTISKKPFSAVKEVYVGGRENLAAVFNGQLGGVRMFDRALTPEVVEQLYNKELPKYKE